MDRFEVVIEIADIKLPGTLTLPEGGHSIVLFAHGSGSSRHSARNQFVARTIQKEGVGTLLFDLLTEEEGAYDEETAAFRFDIPLLAARVIGAIDWFHAQTSYATFRIGCFGASTGAAAALIAASKRPENVHAVVSRGGRPDLALDDLPFVEAPTLLIVGSLDHQVVTLNKEALQLLRCDKQMILVDGATHLFEEPGALEQVSTLASVFFSKHLL